MSTVNRDSLIRLFHESQQTLRRYVQRVVGSRETAEDIVQEAFLKTYQQYDQVKTPRAFLFTAARNLAFDSHRQTRAQKTDAIADVEKSDALQPGESLETGELSEERSRLLREAVERLPPQCRAAFALRFFHACSYKEIAERMGVTPKTVENHIARAVHETHGYVRRRYQVK